MNSTVESQEAKSASEWGAIARTAAEKALATNKYGEWQWSERYHEIAKHAAKMELLMTRRAQLKESTISTATP